MWRLAEYEMLNRRVTNFVDSAIHEPRVINIEMKLGTRRDGSSTTIFESQ